MEREPARTASEPRGARDGKRIHPKRDDARTEAEEDGDGGEIGVEPAALGLQAPPSQEIDAGRGENRHESLLREAARRRAREFLAAEIEAGSYAPHRCSWSSFDPDFSRRAGAAGFIGVTWPKDYGGQVLTGSCAS